LKSGFIKIGLVLNFLAFFKRTASSLNKLAIPITCGLVGIGLTIFFDKIPPQYTSLVIVGFLLLLFMTHVIWFQKALQSLRKDLKVTTEIQRYPSPTPSPHKSVKEEHNHGVLLETTFFQLLRDNLNVEHAPYIQAQCVQDNKTHLVQTSGLIPLLKENQLEILAQPIVSLPQKRVSFFRCVPCVTLENGMIINLNTLTLSSNYALSQQSIERMILYQTLQFVRRHHHLHQNHGFVCYLSPQLYNDFQCLEEMIEFLHQSHFPFQGIIFDVPLDIGDGQFQNLINLQKYGVRFIGKWSHKDLPKNLSELALPSVDFIMMSYQDLSKWIKKQPRRQSIESLQQIHDFSTPVIISNVDQEQDLYHYLPVPFDFASGNAFGLVKPFSQIHT
jgi:hypothetical protein